MSAPETDEVLIRERALDRGLDLALALDPDDVQFAWSSAQANRRLLPDRVPPELEPWQAADTADTAGTTSL